MNDLHESIAERLGVPIEDVEKALKHRVFPDDHFWNAWDNAVADGAALYRDVEKRSPGEKLTPPTKDEEVR